MFEKDIIENSHYVLTLHLFKLDRNKTGGTRNEPKKKGQAKGFCDMCNVKYIDIDKVSISNR